MLAWNCASCFPYFIFPTKTTDFVPNFGPNRALYFTHFVDRGSVTLRHISRSGISSRFRDFIRAVPCRAIGSVVTCPMTAQLFTKASNRCATVFASGFTSILRIPTEDKWAQRTIAELPRGARARGLASYANSRTHNLSCIYRNSGDREAARRFTEKICTEVPWKATSTAAALVTRTFRTSSQFSEDQTYDKFTPRRPNFLDVKLPEEPYIPEEGPTIVSDNSLYSTPVMPFRRLLYYFPALFARQLFVPRKVFSVPNANATRS